MNTTWVLIANGSEARLFEKQNNPLHLSLIKQFSHPQSRDKGLDLATDRAGHFNGDTSKAAHGSFNEATSPKQYELERFAQILSNELDAARNENRYNKLILVSSPHFHGLLNKHMNGNVTKMVAKHIEKDYTELKAEELLERIR
ncbi:MAG: host attachment protein [Gammaproteobacteria bacterium]|nr:host attachment protein [Gammaproteobacteria bacterium]